MIELFVSMSLPQSSEEYHKERNNQLEEELRASKSGLFSISIKDDWDILLREVEEINKPFKIMVICIALFVYIINHVGFGVFDFVFSFVPVVFFYFAIKYLLNIYEAVECIRLSNNLLSIVGNCKYVTEFLEWCANLLSNVYSYDNDKDLLGNIGIDSKIIENDYLDTNLVYIVALCYLLFDVIIFEVIFSSLNIKLVLLFLLVCFVINVAVAKQLINVENTNVKALNEYKDKYFRQMMFLLNPLIACVRNFDSFIFSKLPEEYQDKHEVLCRYLEFLYNISGGVLFEYVVSIFGERRKIVYQKNIN